MSVPEDPFTYTGVCQVVGSVLRIRALLPEPDTETAGPAQPAPFMLPHQRTSCHVTTTAVDDIAFLNQLAPESTSVLGSDACDAVLDDPIVADILGHNRRDTDRCVVGGVQLAAEGARLDVTSAALTCEPKRSVFPSLRHRTDELFNRHTVPHPGLPATTARSSLSSAQRPRSCTPVSLSALAK